MRKPFVAILIAGAAASAGFGGAALAHTAAQPKERVIKIVSRRFTFEPNNIVIHKGEAVKLMITTQDVVMGFNAPDFQTRADILPGTVAEVHLRPDKAGTFTYLCDIFCGSGHENMNGTITVVEK